MSHLVQHFINIAKQLQLLEIFHRDDATRNILSLPNSPLCKETKVVLKFV